MEKLLSCIVPFLDSRVLIDNLFANAEKFPTSIEIILVHDSIIPLDERVLGDLRERIPCDLIYLSGDFASAGTARNAGLEIATGKWISFWD